MSLDESQACFPWVSQPRMAWKPHRERARKQAPWQRTRERHRAVDPELLGEGRYERALEKIELEIGLGHELWRVLMTPEEIKETQKLVTKECYRLACLPGAEFPWDTSWGTPYPGL